MAVGEQGVSLQHVAQAIGRGLKVPVVSISPEEAGAHFGFFAMFAVLTFRLPARKRRNGWDGARSGLG